ncbi:hypothetical protein MHU86_17791 [Fragilaria crotonensis]|nr:hypothetical protein MHU86_17791 [Fragilaria crotonensis]
MDIVGIAGDEVAAEPPVIGADPMDMVLLWIGFENEATRDLLRSEGLTTFVDLESMKEKDIRDLAESYGRRTINDGRFIFGVRRIKRLIGLIHWVQDFGRVSEEPSLDTFLADGGDAALFCRALDEAFQRADVRKVEKEQSDTVSKAADPGKFKDEKKWPEWEPAFVNYLSTIQGVNGVPLSYVVREQEEVDRNGTFESFNERTIACSPLKENVQHLRRGKRGSLRTGKSSHAPQEGGTPTTQDAVGALRVRAAIEGISFTECANHLSAQVSELPDQHTPRKVSATGSRAGKKDSEIKRIRGGGQSGKRNGIHMPDGSIWTGFYSDWEQLSKEDRQTVMDTRISNKAKGGRGKPGRKVSEVGSAKKLKEIKGQVAELKRTLASLKSSKDAGGTDESTDDDSTPDNAGDSFGGRQQKRAKTKN